MSDEELDFFEDVSDEAGEEIIIEETTVVSESDENKNISDKKDKKAKIKKEKPKKEKAPKTPKKEKASKPPKKEKAPKAPKKEKAHKPPKKEKAPKAPKPDKKRKDKGAPKKESAFKAKAGKIGRRIADTIASGNNKELPLTKQIKFRLVVSFFIPVIFIILLGVISYSKAKNTIVGNYESTSVNTVDSSASYLNLIMKDIESRASQMAVDETTQYYYMNYESNTAAINNEAYTSINTTLKNLTGSAVGVQSALMFGQVGLPITTVANTTGGTVEYNEFVSSAEGTYMNSDAASGKAWLGFHEYVDNTMGLDTEYYSASYIRKFSQGEGYIIFDMKSSEVDSAMQSALVSDNAIAAFITEDGRETLVSGKEISKESIFTGEDFYKSAVEGDEPNGSSYVTYEGKKNLFVYSKVGETGTIVCCLIPQKDILSSVSAIKIITILLVVIAALVAGFIGLYTAGGIAKATGEFSNSFKSVAQGDLTTDLNLKRQDEFGAMADLTNDMISKMRELVINVAGFGHNVSDAAQEVSESSNHILDSIKDVSVAMEEMEKGIEIQVVDTENGYRQMEDFASRINEVCNNTTEIGQVADSTKIIVEEGKDIVNNLQTQSDATAELTGVIIGDIEELERKSADIGSVVSTINGIAKQTNLLSLNASIEAARAGVAGRGFAVVADEIRKLAEQSVNAVKDIENIIANIQEQTQKTAQSAANAGELLKSQSDALNSTVDVFSKVDSQFDGLVKMIDEILSNMHEIMDGKNIVLDSIKNIAAVTEETNASSTTVRSTVDVQIKSVEVLNHRAEELTEKAKELEQAIQIFKI